MERILHYPRAPRNIERLIDPEQFDRDRPVELSVYRCRACSHVQLAEYLQDEFYDEYLMSHSHAEKMQKFQASQAKAFVEYFGLRGGRVFEAGCGDGQFSLIIKGLGCEVLANEPSAKARRACEKKGLSTVDGFVKAGAFPHLHGTFEAFATRQVLEHVPEPNDFLRELRALLKPGGAGLIEVPALEMAVENERFFDFFPDHLSYFSQNALVHLCSRNSLEVVRLQRAMDGEYNEVWVRRTEHPGLEGIEQAAKSISGSFREFLDREKQAGRKVAIWGSGAKGVLTLAMVDTASVAYLVDLDRVKHGRYTPVSHLEVCPTERLLAEPVDTVIITALAYKNEIIRDLKTKFAFQGKIAFLSGGNIEEAGP
ncbi:MAG: methyltransferase domain-containing protein [Candidatus Glassbacteria bacterium]|nr:methyltransferase domain-containing protein [Candidatus Glassbacteria bacterium]